MSGCWTKQPFTDKPGPRLGFVGDSITWQSTTDINAHYPDSNVAIHAIVGGDTMIDSAWVAADAISVPDVEVINLGTNDARRVEAGQVSMTDVLARFDQFAAIFPCVVFVTVDTHNPSWAPADAQTINDHLRTFPHVADWDATLTPADFDSLDDPHPNETGRQELLSTIDAAKALC